MSTMLLQKLRNETARAMQSAVDYHAVVLHQGIHNMVLTAARWSARNNHQFTAEQYNDLVAGIEQYRANFTHYNVYSGQTGVIKPKTTIRFDSESYKAKGWPVANNV